jgi:signal transduction histidine kinase
MLAFVGATLIGFVTRGGYYLARSPLAAFGGASGPAIRCEICDHSYERDDMAYCNFYERPICSLCCSLDAHCHDSCKKSSQTLERSRSRYLGETAARRIAPHTPQRILKVGGLLIALAVVTAALFLLTYHLADPRAATAQLDNGALLLRVFLAMLPLLAVGAWWVVLSAESHEMAHRNLVRSLEKLNETQDELARTERLAAIGQLTATVSHELRNPLGTLMSSVAILKRSTRPDTAIDGEFDRVQRNIRRCVRIIDDLLEFSRRPNVAMAPLALDAWLCEQAADLSALAPVRLELDLSCDRMIEADGERLRQVLINLVQNGMQAVLERAPASGGRVLVSTRCLGDEVLLRVVDDGIGMRDEVKSRLFEPLYSTKPFGLGLGLALVRRIVERHGGQLAIESQPNDGCMVEIRLPAMKPELAYVS